MVFTAESPPAHQFGTLPAIDRKISEGHLTKSSNKESGINDKEKVQYNGALLPDIILLTQSYYVPSGNPSKYHEEFFFVFAAYDPT